MSNVANTPGERSQAVQWAELAVYLATSIAFVWLSVEEWRLRRAVDQAKDKLMKMGLIERIELPRVPTAPEISALHAEIRAMERTIPTKTEEGS